MIETITMNFIRILFNWKTLYNFQTLLSITSLGNQNCLCVFTPLYLRYAKAKTDELLIFERVKFVFTRHGNSYGF